MTINNKYIKAAATSLICTIAAAAIMVLSQTLSSNADENRMVDMLMSEIPSRLDEESRSREALIQEYDQAFCRDLASVKYLLETDGQRNFFERVSEAEPFATTIFLVGDDGIILNGTDKTAIGCRLDEVCTLPQDEYGLIMDSEGFVNTGVHKSADGDLVKTYAVPFDGKRLVMPSVLKGKYAAVYSLDNMGGLFGAMDERLFVAPIDNTTLLFGTLKTAAADFSGQPISALNLEESVTREPSSGRSEVMGYGFRYRTVQYKSDVLGDITILAAYTDAGAVPPGPLAILLVTILLVTFLLQMYGLYIDEEPGRLQLRVDGLRPVGRKGCTFDMEKARILLPFSLVCIVIVTAAGFYLNSLNMVANQCWTCRWNIQQVSESLGRIEKGAEDNFNAETEDIASFLQVTSSVLEDRQSVLLDCRDASRLKKVKAADGTFRTVEICNPWLSGLAQTESASDISIYDGEGRLVSTSGTRRNLGFSRGDGAAASVFDVIDGVSASRQVVDGGYLIVCVPFTLHKDGAASDAMLISRFNLGRIHDNSVMESITGTFDAASQSGHCHYLMAVAEEGHKAVYSAAALGAEALNMPDAAYSDGYLGYHKIKDTRYYVATKLIGGGKRDYYIMSFVPQEEVYLGRGGITAAAFIVTLLIMLVLLSILLIYGPDKTAAVRMTALKEMKERESMTPVQLEKMNVDIKRTPTSSQKILGLMGKTWIVILFFIFLSLIKGLCTGPDETLAGYLMSFSWQRGINIFSLTSMLTITFSFAFCLFLLTKLMSVLGKALNSGAETACQLLVSLLRYAGYIAVLFVTLYMFGVDTTGVLASLGAFSVMVGLGAKNLITDILAGISIIMEKDYKVGDIVNIGGFCGKVTEIGIRTTKVEDIDGNVKIFYNSGVNGVINMTSRLSAVRLDVKIATQHTFEDVEKAFHKFFECITNKYPQIKGDSKFLGLQDSTPTFNVFRISIPCDEIDRAPLRRAVIKELSRFCVEENINKM